MKNQSMTMTPGVFSSTIYHIIKEVTIAIAVPAMRPKNPSIDWPLVTVMPMAMMIMDQTGRIALVQYLRIESSEA